jgi:hypothetical protein
VLLARLTPTGEGLDFGRSIGPYGETAYLEVLSAAATLGVLTPTERDMAYTYSVRVAERYARFWYDGAMQSVNLWEHGRGTDAYRGKHRILGENLSLVHQLLYTTQLWEALGYRTRAPRADFTAWLAARPRVTLTWFARGTHDRALLTVRDGLRVFSLPVINGGAGQHQHTPYYPLPFSPGIVVGVADATFPQLTPTFFVRTTGDSTRALMPLAYQQGVALQRAAARTTLRWSQSAMDWIGARGPRPDSSFATHSATTIAPGEIRRVDRYTPRGAVRVDSMAMEYAVPADTARVSGLSVTFGSGSTVRQFTAVGFDRCQVLDAPPLASNVGPLSTRIRCTRAGGTMSAPFELGWTLRYRRTEARMVGPK